MVECGCADTLNECERCLALNQALTVKGVGIQLHETRNIAGLCNVRGGLMKLLSAYCPNRLQVVIKLKISQRKMGGIARSNGKLRQI